MSADYLRQAANELREFWPNAPIEPLLAGPLADWLDNVGAWIDEGVGVAPDTNLADAWTDTVILAGDVARLINEGAPA